MSLENSLEIKRLESTIGQIENSKYDSEKIEDEKEVSIIDYENRIKEKLPNIINNIRLIKEKIFALGESYWSVKVNSMYLENGSHYHIEIVPGKYPRLTIDHGYRMNLIFEKDKDAFKNISLNEYIGKFPKSFRNTFLGRIADDERLPLVSLQIFLEDHKRHKIESKSPEEFSEQFAKLISASWNWEENHSSLHREWLLQIPKSLNEIPEEITSRYSIRTESKNRRLKEITANSEGLTSLDVSDF